MNIRHKRKEKEESVSTARELFQWVAAIVAAVLIALAIDNFVIVNAQIPSGSMENTIMTGDRVIGNRFAYSFSDPQRFDIIIFRYPDDERQLFIKRIIGLPGETVEIRDGKIYLQRDIIAVLTEQRHNLLSQFLQIVVRFGTKHIAED